MHTSATIVAALLLLPAYHHVRGQAMPPNACTFAQDCTPGDPVLIDDGSPQCPLVVLYSGTGGNANGPGCDGCTFWATGIVVWRENGYSVMAMPDGAETGSTVTFGDFFKFGGSQYRSDCGESASWDFVSPTHGASFQMSCSDCQ